MTNLFVASELEDWKRYWCIVPTVCLGKVVPSKAQDWLFEDIVHLDTIRKDEYDYSYQGTALFPGPC